MAASSSVLAHKLPLLLGCLQLLLLSAHEVLPITKCFPPDRAALQDFADSFNLRFFQMYWRPELDCCSWVGVKCGLTINATSTNSSSAYTGYSRVVGLSLIDRGLQGAIPPALCHLSALSLLDLSAHPFPILYSHDSFASKRLTGPIPSCIGRHLTNLELLILPHNRLNSIIPPSFSRLARLKTLHLSFNLNLSGSISPISNLPLLTYLNLSVNSFTGSIMPLLNSPSLQFLDLSTNSFSGPISYPAAPSSNTSHLRVLNLGLNEQLQGDLPSLPHLKSLLLDGTSLSINGSTISNLLCELKSLGELSILIGGSTSFTTLDQELRCEKPASADLLSLSLGSDHLTGPLPAWIGSFSKLQVLHLAGRKFSGSIPQEWQTLKQLVSFGVLAAANFPSASTVLLPQKVQSWLFRLPLQDLRLTSMGLTNADLQCTLGLSLLNQTLVSLDLSDNHLSGAVWDCLALHNFSRLSALSLGFNPLAMSVVQLRPLAHPLYALYLEFCQLSGNLSMELLSSAQGIELADNNLTGTIPSQIGSLGSYSIALDLSYNNLTGSLPASLGNLSFNNLLRLDNNHLQGEIPKQVLGSDKLNPAILTLGNNQFTEASFRDTHFSHLMFLDLGFNKLEGDVQELVGNYSALTTLIVLLLSNNQLSGSLPTSLGSSAPNLIILDLSNNRLTGAIPESLKLFPAFKYDATAVQRLLFNYTLPSVKSVKFQGYVGQRVYLGLSFNNLSGSIPEGLGELLWLRDLNLSHNQLSGPIPPSLANLKLLETLDLSFNNLQGPIPTAFSQLSSLEVFNVSFNPELRGPIPTGSQIETADSYQGDLGLCGIPVDRECRSGTDQTEAYDQHKRLGRSNCFGENRGVDLHTRDMSRVCARAGIDFMGFEVMAF